MTSGGMIEDHGRPRPARKRAARRDLLLNEAARSINALGAGSIVLHEIAERVGLSRNALYYYVTDRADLVFRTYLRACETMADDLGLASEQGGNPAERLSLFVHSSLVFGRPDQAVLSDIDYLPEPQRGLIAEHHRRNVAHLQDMITEGVTSGVFRPCDSEIAAQALIGMLSWSRLAAEWLGYRDGKAARRRMANAITDLLLNGIALDPQASSLCDIDVETLVLQSYNAFDRRQISEVKTTQLIAAASRLFNRRGVDGASMDEISAAVGATKGALYHYFDDKADLVVQCYSRAFALYEVFMQAATSRGKNGFEWAMICLHLNVQAQAGPLSPLMPQPGRAALPEEAMAKFSLTSRKLRMTSARSLRQGMHDGTCRPCDCAFVSEVVAGIFLWLPKWLPDGYPLSPMQIADELSNLFAQGLKVRTA